MLAARARDCLRTQFCLRHCSRLGRERLRWPIVTASRQASSSGSSQQKDDNENEERQNEMRQRLFFYAVALAGFAGYSWLSWRENQADESSGEVTWNEFMHQLLANGEVAEVVLPPRNSEQRVEKVHSVVVRLHPGVVFHGERYALGKNVYLKVPDLERFEEQLRAAERQLGIASAQTVPITYNRDGAGPLVSAALILAFLYFIFRMGGGKMGVRVGGSDMFGSLRQARYRLIDSSSSESAAAPQIRFKDVAGLNEAKQEVHEFVDILRRPQDFTRLGAKLPRGALLLGPPGCGKTLLAKAVAAEARVPFLAVNGPEFVDMIGGVGASRVRDLFSSAQKKAPCIVFIDEIDALGRKRSGETDASGGSSDSEQTLNQLLVSMDGMDTTKGVIVMAATNRSDILDKALLRRGRFDRHVNIDPPNAADRKEIFELYLGKVALSGKPSDYSTRFAQMTPGFTGADIASVCNEAAIHAASNQKAQVTAASLDFALERVMSGAEKRSTVMAAVEKEVIAYHEAGRVLVGWLLEHTDALLKVSIVPRTTSALGFAKFSPADRKLYSQEELYDRMRMTLGGRAAESVRFNSLSTAAETDLRKVTRLAFAQVRQFGMSAAVGPLSFGSSGDPDAERAEQFQKKPYSKRLQALIDGEATLLVGAAYRSAEDIVRRNREKLDLLASNLLLREVLSYDDVKRLLGAPPFGEKSKVEFADVLPVLDLPPEP